MTNETSAPKPPSPLPSERELENLLAEHTPWTPQSPSPQQRARRWADDFRRRSDTRFWITPAVNAVPDVVHLPDEDAQ